MYHLNYFQFTLQPRVQIIMAYIACMDLPLSHHNTLDLFTVLTSREVGWLGGQFCGELTLVCSRAVVSVALPILSPSEVVERGAFQSSLSAKDRRPTSQECLKEGNSLVSSNFSLSNATTVPGPGPYPSTPQMV